MVPFVTCILLGPVSLRGLSASANLSMHFSLVTWVIYTHCYCAFIISSFYFLFWTFNLLQILIDTCIFPLCSNAFMVVRMLSFLVNISMHYLWVHACFNMRTDFLSELDHGCIRVHTCNHVVLDFSCHDCVFF